MKTRLPLWLLALVAGMSNSHAQTVEEMNLGFEQVGSDPSRPKVWSISGDGFAPDAPGYDIALDEQGKRSGLRSLRMKATGKGSFGNAYQSIPAKIAAGRRVTIRGWIRTSEVARGYAGLWCRIDGPAGMLAHHNSAVRIDAKGRTTIDDRGARGTTDWKQYSIEHQVPDNATAIVFGAILVGDGTAWWDDYSVEVDDAPYQGKPLAELAAEREPKAAELEWLRENSVAFGTERAGSGLDDLMPLKRAIGEARIVSLGEATHGTAEFFRMKHRLVEFLATEMGFTAFGIEANMPEAFRLNEYVLHGKGDPKELLEGMYFWTWNTQEVLDMILWMRGFNASGRGRMEFLGFDMQEPKVAAEIVRDFVARADLDYKPALEDAYAGLKDYRELAQQLAPAWARQGSKPPSLLGALAARAAVVSLGEKARGVLKHMEGERDKLIEAAGGDALAADWAIQNARIVVQAMETSTGSHEHRDRCMADNTDWILAHRPPGTKIVLWAHNGHVKKRKGSMGGFLAERHGAEMVVAGFAFHEGRYTAVATGAGLKSNDAGPSEPGSVEWAFHRAGLARAILDLRKVEKGSPGSGWLTLPVGHRNIGALAMGSAFYPAELAGDYDLLIFFDQTTASMLLPPRRRN